MFKLSFIKNLLLVFVLIYDINTTILPSITSGRVVMLFLIVTNFNFLLTTIKRNSNYILVLVLLLLYSLIQSFFSEDTTQFSRLFYFVLYSVFGGALLAKRINNTQELLKLFLVAGSVQSLFLIYGFFTPSFKLLLENYIFFGSNFTAENLYRAMGVTSSSGAALSVIQALCVASGVRLMYEENNKIYIVLTALCFMSTILVGRTGLVLSIFFTIIFVYKTVKLKNIVIYGLAILFISSINLGGFLISKLEGIEGFSVNYFTNWLDEGFDIKDNRTVNVLLYEQRIPPLTSETLFIGTGTITKDGINTSGHDSGYIQTYYSLGLLLTVVFYLSFLFFIKNKFKNLNKQLIILLLFVVFLLEFKEPMMFKYLEVLMITSFLWLKRNDI